MNHANYALRVTVEWIQALELFVPVQRYQVVLRRRKGERVVQLDWHAAVRLAEPPPIDHDRHHVRAAAQLSNVS